MKVIFLHHAGGDKYSWKRYDDSLSSQIEKIYIELPGRGDRYSEKLLTDTTSMVDDIFTQVLPHLSNDYILVGKSMGALHAYLLLQKIMKDHLPLPVHVFLGSRKCPASYASHLPIAQLDSEKFWEGVQAYGGCPPALLQHRELMELYEPILKADFSALESYQYVEQPKIPVNATIMVGKEDQISIADVQSWQNHFDGELTFLELLGGHFFMHEQAFTIGKMIEEQFSNHHLKAIV